jgi:cytochrome P450
LIQFDPYSDAQRNDPYPAYAELRRHSPVTKIEKMGAYVVARYADVCHVLRHPELFSSRAMRTAMGSPLADSAGASAPSPAEAARLAEMIAAMPISIPEWMATRSLIDCDPPVHGPMRSVVNRGFTPRRVAELEARVRVIARNTLAAFERKPDFDLVTDLFTPLPVTVIAELLGVEPERSADFKHWSDCVVTGSTGAAGKSGPATMLEGISGLLRYILKIAERRRDEPRDDLISALIRARDGEAALTPIESANFGLLLLLAGNETTTNLLGNAVLALLANPDELARVRRDPSRIPALVEETLRYDSPIQFIYREATQDVELGGVRIPAGAVVIPLLGSANRDEAQFPDADRFDVSRDTQGHVAFGLGIHFCLGASLARLEARVALEELLARYEYFECREPRVQYVDSYVVRGPKRLPLRAAAAPAHGLESFRAEAVKSPRNARDS